MKPIIRTTIGILLTFVLCCCAGWCGQSIEEFNSDSKIDWTNHIYIARGRGAMPTPKEEPNRARAYLKAEKYAEMAAIANLQMAIEGTAIDYNSSGKDFMADVNVRQHIEGFVKNVEITKHWKEQEEGNTIVVAEVRATMFGSNSPGSVFLDELQQTENATNEIPAVAPVKVVMKPDALPAKNASKSAHSKSSAGIASARPSSPGMPYTSLVIDTIGYKVDRCMSPKIRREDGSEVWGTVKADLDYVEEHGIAVYATCMEDAKKNARCGANPLIIRAIGRSGGNFFSDPVISDADAQLVLDENAKSSFLDKFNVIIIKDGRL